MEKFGSGINIPVPQLWKQMIVLYLFVKVLESLAEKDEEVVATWYLFDLGSGTEKFGSGINPQLWKQILVLFLFLGSRIAGRGG
jgi:hypothetical protein